VNGEPTLYLSLALRAEWQLFLPLCSTNGTIKRQVRRVTMRTHSAGK